MTKDNTQKSGDDNVIIIKKYPNRRLYNTDTSVYVTLEDLAQLVKDEQDFVVIDAKTGEDLTRQVLTQIIFEMENKGNALLPTQFLRSVIRFYDDSMSTPLQHYLDSSMQAFVSNQEKFRHMTAKAMQEFSPLSHLEEMTRQNMALFEKTFSMFNPFISPDSQKDSPTKKPETQRKRKTSTKD